MVPSLVLDTLPLPPCIRNILGPSEESPINQRVEYFPGEESYTCVDRAWQAAIYAIEIVAGATLFEFGQFMLTSMAVICFPALFLVIPCYIVSIGLVLHGVWGLATKVWGLAAGAFCFGEDPMNDYLEQYEIIKSYNKDEVDKLITQTLGISAFDINMDGYRLLNEIEPTDAMKKILTQIMVLREKIMKVKAGLEGQKDKYGHVYETSYDYCHLYPLKLEMAYLIAVLKNPKMTMGLTEQGTCVTQKVSNLPSLEEMRRRTYYSIEGSSSVDFSDMKECSPRDLATKIWG